eukprot:TRINITY_DN55984_c0_g1_i1.p1 TRINITY_DN55984_c0_g1~~TRINITY_DN55984_c0_g1_i1.p1  ORF type:complete len:475 (+),score=76.09 TRINITY_DN55984_c0_g1_i1:136-1560(+)
MSLSTRVVLGWCLLLIAVVSLASLGAISRQIPALNVLIGMWRGYVVVPLFYICTLPTLFVMIRDAEYRKRIFAGLRYCMCTREGLAVTVPTFISWLGIFYAFEVALQSTTILETYALYGLTPALMVIARRQASPRVAGAVTLVCIGVVLLLLGGILYGHATSGRASEGTGGTTPWPPGTDEPVPTTTVVTAAEPVYDCEHPPLVRRIVGDVAAIASAVALGVFLTYQKAMEPHVPFLLLQSLLHTWNMVAHVVLNVAVWGVHVRTGVSLFVRPMDLTLFFHDGGTCWRVVAMACIGWFLGYGLSSLAARYLPATAVAAVLALDPVLATLWGVALGVESWPQPLPAVGMGAITLGCMAIAAWDDPVPAAAAKDGTDLEAVGEPFDATDAPPILMATPREAFAGPGNCPFPLPVASRASSMGERLPAPIHHSREDGSDTHDDNDHVSGPPVSAADAAAMVCAERALSHIFSGTDET